MINLKDITRFIKLVTKQKTNVRKDYHFILISIKNM